MVDMLARSEERLITRISAVRRDDLELVGGKGANLGELMQAGFPVPDGFIVSTEAYATVVEEAALATVIANGLAAGDDGATIRAAFENVTIPDGLTAAIIAAYTELGGGPVAVRSSATAEDLARGGLCGPAGHLPQSDWEGCTARRRTPVLGIAVDRAGHCVSPPSTGRVRQPSDRGGDPADGGRRVRRSDVHSQPGHGRSR
jgi:Pyruvate phosphate dikinase, AMP/ATP-binding domain